MTEQVTSIEQSKRLIELGVPAEKASMVWEMDEDCARLKIWNTDKETRRVLHNKYPNYYVPAFTVVDLLAVLPKKIMTNGGKVNILHIEVCSSTNHCWCLFWGDEEIQIGWCEHISFLHLIEYATEWLLSMSIN